jgi:hypothetical protein
MKKTILIPQFSFILVPLIALVLFFLPYRNVNAQVTPGFGGFQTFNVPCTCSVPGTFWIWLTPLFYDSPLPITGPMVYTPAFSTLYMYYEIDVPLTWELGDFVPDAGTCWISVGIGCAPLPSLGVMDDVGTSQD